MTNTARPRITETFPHEIEHSFPAEHAREELCLPTVSGLEQQVTEKIGSPHSTNFKMNQMLAQGGEGNTGVRCMYPLGHVTFLSASEPNAYAANVPHRRALFPPTGVISNHIRVSDPTKLIDCELRNTGELPKRHSSKGDGACVEFKIAVDASNIVEHDKNSAIMTCFKLGEVRESARDMASVHQKGKDEDEIWKRFVFGSSADCVSDF
jgi:hypothetical protein